MSISSEDRLRAILDGTRAGTWEWNLDTDGIIVNARWCEMLGYEPSELEPITRMTWESLCHPADLAIARRRVSRYLKGEIPFYESVLRLRHKAGGWCWVHSRGILMTDESGSGARWFVGTHLDVTHERESQLHLEQLAKSLPGFIFSFEMTAEGRWHFPYLNRDWDHHDVPKDGEGVDISSLFKGIHPEDVPAVEASVRASFARLRPWKCEFRAIVDDQTHWMEAAAQPEKDVDGNVTWYGMAINIDQRKALELELQRLSVTDELTGLFNRRYMMGKLEEFFGIYQRYGTAFSLVSLDIDHFKRINDRFGHLGGDCVLRHFAQVLAERVRKTDIVARTGGEEFMLLLPNTDLDSALTVAESLRQAIEAQPIEVSEDERVYITVSEGVVQMGRHLRSFQEMLAVCDKSLYRAKHLGRNQVVVSAH